MAQITCQSEGSHLGNAGLQVFSLAFLLSLHAHLFAAEKYVLKVVTDRPDAIYKTGEEARFLISMTKDGKPVSGQKVSYQVDDFIPGTSGYPNGTITLGEKPSVVKVTAKKPGILRCIVRATEPNKMIKIAAAAFSPLEIGPSLPVPDDFDQFWTDQKKQLAAVPAKAKLAVCPDIPLTLVFITEMSYYGIC